ncbi:hypothetical protein GCM10009799_33550 [Nocardiopsis rhodophaea]|uniref:Uncharacterized protein n=1 Tax=Nocardiopsis rhodophaea TaxID=280238 RepID=A0ABN2TAU9_9ACTN
MSVPTSLGQIRSSLLSQLQAEIHCLGRPALVALGNTDYPVLYAPRPDGTRVAIVAMRLLDRWWFIAGDRNPIPVDSPASVAHLLIEDAKRDVRELFSRRPRPRGSRMAAAAA